MGKRKKLAPVNWTVQPGAKPLPEPTTAEAPPFNFTGIPPGDVMESFLSDILTNTQASLDVAHEGTSKLSQEEAVKVAAVLATVECNQILAHLQGHSRKTLRVRHRALLSVFEAGVERMTAAVSLYEEDKCERRAVGVAKATISFLTAAHKVFSDKTKKKQRDRILIEYLGN